jgi:hypothetical protein
MTSAIPIVRQPTNRCEPQDAPVAPLRRLRLLLSSNLAQSSGP